VGGDFILSCVDQRLVSERGILFRSLNGGSGLASRDRSRIGGRQCGLESGVGCLGRPDSGGGGLSGRLGDLAGGPSHLLRICDGSLGRVPPVEQD
jgi:hypothetical protein